MSDTVLTATNLARYYPVSQGAFAKPKLLKALNGVSFSLDKAKTIAVVGESGCGKSTLARQLTLIEAPTAGELVINGESALGVSKSRLKQLRTEVQMVFQNPYASLNPRQTIIAQLTEPLTIHTKLSKSEKHDQAIEMVKKVGLRPEHASRYPHMFSGGQRQRIALARAMMLNPPIVVADEPTSALDVSIQAQVLNLFQDLQAQFHTAYVFISHNLSVVRYVADDVMVMYLGKVVEHGATEDIFNRPLHPYTRALLSAAPSIREQSEHIKLKGELPSPLTPPTGCALHQRCPFAVAECASIVPELRMVEGHQVACHRAEVIHG